MEETLRILLCPNAFKGSLTAMEAVRAMQEGVDRVGALPVGADGALRRLVTIACPLADGGDGTLETLVDATGGTLVTETVQGPLGEPVSAQWGRLGGTQRDTAVIEMAQASGLRLLRPEARNPVVANTFGTGQLMRAAMEAGCRSLLVGIGGSATNDGGAGMAQALGARFLDSAGRELPPGGLALQRLARIDLSAFYLPEGTQIRVACDVDNPLCGAEGASAIYGPQKGATPELIPKLDAALGRYADIVKAQWGKDVCDIPGAGAAGGLGAGLLAFCAAQLQSGIEIVMQATDFDAKLAQCSLALTGEGALDGQTGRGKVVAGVAERAQAAGVAVIALAGSVAEGAEEALRQKGLTGAISIVTAPVSLEIAMASGYRMLTSATERILRLLTVRLR